MTNEFFQDYVIEFYDFLKDGNPFQENNIVKNKVNTKAAAKSMAKPTCRTCWGKGWILLDSPKLYMMTRYCDCIINKTEKAKKREDLRKQYEKDGKLEIWENGFRVRELTDTKWGSKYLPRNK